MKINFEGTMEEFCALFRMAPVDPQLPAPVVPATELPVDPYEMPEEPVTGVMAKPKNDPAVVAGNVVLPSLREEQREDAWRKFQQFSQAWITGFKDPEAEQPDRLGMMQELGQGRWPVPILVMAYEIGSLQRMVEKALVTSGAVADPDLDHIDEVAANMVQISHMGFPDLAGTYDYSTKWRRSNNAV
jgi:hypothetical protein